jgi:hypothetical protein
VHPHPVAAEFAAAVARRDSRRLAVMLTQTARLRALLPAAVLVAHGRADVVDSFLGWFADFDTLEVLESAGEPVADRLLIHYRLALSRAQTRWVCTQTAVCKIVDGQLAVIDLLCSGFREVSPNDHTPGHWDPPVADGAGWAGDGRSRSVPTTSSRRTPSSAAANAVPHTAATRSRRAARPRERSHRRGPIRRVGGGVDGYASGRR